MSKLAVDPLELVAGQIALDAESVRRRAEEVLADDLFWFPVRHHSPAAAAHVRSAIRARRPKVIFLEAPANTQDLVKHLVDSKTKPPVAIYSSYRDDDNLLGLAGIASAAPDIPARFACWYPLVAYSPEYVTMRTAAEVGAQVVFMDLPHHALIRPHDAEGSEPARKTPVSPADDTLFAESGFFQKLAEVAGYSSWNEGWDSLFEFGALAEDGEAFRRELAIFCAAVRATSPAARLDFDGTLARERFMSQTIRETLRDRKIRPHQAMVVCGGFHLFLDGQDPTPPPVPPEGTVYSSIVPYSYFRISELSGYAAGNRAPQFYQLHWELRESDRGEDLLGEHVVAILKRARKEGATLSPADAIAVTQHARMLGSLRGRSTPILDDIDDALLTCCVKGNPADVGQALQKARDAIAIGNRIGVVTPALGRLPLVNDFYNQLNDFELSEVAGKEQKLTLKLDKRKETDARRSAFLHRVRYLDVKLAAMERSERVDSASGLIFGESWQLKWNPQLEPALVERSLYGDTIETAALAMLREKIASDDLHAGKTCGHLLAALDMDLSQMVSQLEAVCAEAIDTDGRFVSLTQAVTHLTLLDRHSHYRDRSRDQVAELIRRAFDRACFALPDASSVPEDEQPAVVEGLSSLAELVLHGEREGVERDLFTKQVRFAAGLTNVPFLRGALLGMLAELREMSAADLAQEISSLARGPVEEMLRAGEFLEGVLAVSRTSIMVGADSLVAAIDELLRAADWDQFLIMLPRMRKAFEQMHERHVDSIAARVARHYGLAKGEELQQLSTSVAAAAVLARIDAQVAEIMKKWEL